MTETGNPNVFTTYKGKYQVRAGLGQRWDTKNIMLTATNSVCFMGNVEVHQNVSTAVETVFGLLPPECRPQHTAFIQALYYQQTAQGDYEYAVQEWCTIRIQHTGEIVLQKQNANGILYLNGLMFNIGDNWYR